DGVYGAAVVPSRLNGVGVFETRNPSRVFRWVRRGRKRKQRDRPRVTTIEHPVELVPRAVSMADTARSMEKKY
ncbi:hypothetical protein, partial [Halopiger djelfimassiliensis]|uniref:hypothetical protein n=1 Tax=Halopiger djelfimassiliensis TaxID=1293047 RepID=UPI001E30FBDA